MALEPIDVVTHSREIEQEYLKVVRGNDPDTTWLIISPNEKKEYAPQYVGSGFGQFLNSFDDVKVQYGIARVSPPGSDVEKIVLIGWCPDSAPMKTRASFASNFGTVANQVFKGYHIQVTARDSDDLDENQLLQRVSNAAGARYSIQSTGTSIVSKTTGSSRLATPSSTPAPNAAPLRRSPGPTPAGKSTNDDDDEWGEPEVKERDLERNPVKNTQSSYKPIGKVDLQKVIAEEKAKEDPRLVNNVPVESKRAPVGGFGPSATSNLNLETKPKSVGAIPVNTGGGMLGTKPPINFGLSQSRDDDKVIKGFKNEKSPAQIWAEKKAAQNGGVLPTPAPTATSSAPPPQPVNVPEPIKGPDFSGNGPEPEVKDLKSKYEQLSTNTEPPIIQPKAPTNQNTIGELESKPVASFPPPPSNQKQFGTPLPGMHTEDDGKDNNENEGGEDDEWGDDGESQPAAPQSQPAAPQSQPAAPQSQPLEQPAPPLPGRAPNQEDTVPPFPPRNAQPEEEQPTLPPRNPVAQEQGPPPPELPSRKTDDGPEDTDSNLNAAAIADYDYSAAEDNELSFKETERIINIEFVDDDWWLGELESTGEKGLFPSNYVTLVN